MKASHNTEPGQNSRGGGRALDGGSQRIASGRIGDVGNKIVLKFAGRNGLGAQNAFGGSHKERSERKKREYSRLKDHDRRKERNEKKVN